MTQLQIPSVYDRLTKDEVRKLRSLLKERGELKKSSMETGLNVNTIKRAKEGLDILIGNANIIRAVLLKDNSEPKEKKGTQRSPFGIWS
jgi:hypothetical protein